MCSLGTVATNIVGSPQQEFDSTPSMRRTGLDDTYRKWTFNKWTHNIFLKSLDSCGLCFSPRSQMTRDSGRKGVNWRRMRICHESQLVCAKLTYQELTL